MECTHGDCMFRREEVSFRWHIHIGSGLVFVYEIKGIKEWDGRVWRAWYTHIYIYMYNNNNTNMYISIRGGKANENKTAALPLPFCVASMPAQQSRRCVGSASSRGIKRCRT